MGNYIMFFYGLGGAWVELLVVLDFVVILVF